MNQDSEFPFDRARRVTPEEHQHFKAMVANHRAKIATADDTDDLRPTEGHRAIQIQTVEIKAIVAPDGTTTLQLPPEITPGEHHITLLIQVEQPIAS
jgi:hypothetical protein